MSGRRWYCMECHADLGPVVGKHKGTCPRCGSKSAYATPRGSDVQPKLVKEQEGERMSESYTVDGFEVVFTPWHSESLTEDFMGVSVRRDGYEVLHAGMTKLVPSVEQAREIVETMTMLEEALKAVSE